MCLAQGHNAVSPVRLDPATIRSRLKYSTVEPLRSQYGVNESKTKQAEGLRLHVESRGELKSFPRPTNGAMACAPIDDSDHPAHARRLICVFNGRYMGGQRSIPTLLLACWKK